MFEKEARNKIAIFSDHVSMSLDDSESGLMEEYAKLRALEQSTFLGGVHSTTV